VGLFIVTTTQIQHSNRLQINHLNDYQKSFNIAYSALVELLADLQKKQWKNRSFKTNPEIYSREIFGGRFYLKAEDYDPDNYIFNVKIRTKTDKKYSLYYWRLKYIPSLLDFTRLTIPLYFSHFPAKGTDDDFTRYDDEVDSDLEKCKDNWDKAREIAEELNKKDTFKEVIEGLGIPAEDISKNNTDRNIPEDFSISDNSLETSTLEEIIEDTPGIVKTEIEKVVSELPLTDIYPPPTDLKEILTIPVTRYEIVVYMIRLLGLPEDNDQAAVENFEDIQPSEDEIQNIFNIAVSSAFTFNLVIGWEGNFYGDQAMRREHMAIFLQNIDDYITFALPELNNEELYDKYQKIQQWINEEKSKFEEINPESGLTIGDGMEILTDLQ
jgi:hypothetical protein